MGHHLRDEEGGGQRVEEAVEKESFERIRNYQPGSGESSMRWAMRLTLNGHHRK
jgi:hypothetical protein